ncbi:MAG: 3'-5' exonuclease domain-containing protein 2 [Kiritimatiellaeota bacterium]|nr:3'-5' exonuclease domain-containing protein 2 [Kiritimatiellota bacterium]
MPNQHAPMEFQPDLTHEQVMALPLGHYEGPIHLISSPAQLAEALPALNHERVLGFDTETRAAFRKGEAYPPALIQLATAHAVWLVQLRAFATLDGLADLLGSAQHLKAGVGLDYDLRKLRENFEFKPAGFVDLAKLSDTARIRANGLRGLAAHVLGIRIAKQAQCTNWARTDLTEQQLRYAATDAWISREIFLALEQRIAQKTADA